MTVIHESIPAPIYQDSSNGLGFFLGVLMLILFLFMLFYYGLPLLRNASSSPQINIPSQVDVNLKQPTQ